MKYLGRMNPGYFMDQISCYEIIFHWYKLSRKVKYASFNFHGQSTCGGICRVTCPTRDTTCYQFEGGVTTPYVPIYLKITCGH